jgi:hypothetical protein
MQCLNLKKQVQNFLKHLNMIFIDSSLTDSEFWKTQCPCCERYAAL